jgi:Ino eighty subunit 1
VSEGHQRTMFQQAWRNAITNDPLADSDDEPLDQHARIDYARRLGVISRIRRRPPTPT